MLDQRVGSARTRELFGYVSLVDTDNSFDNSFDELMNAYFAEQPKYIQSIVGYSPTKGRTYFRDRKGKAYLSSFDGVRMDVVNPSNMAAVRLLCLSDVYLSLNESLDRSLETRPLSLL